MKRKTDNFSKFYNKKSNAAIKEGFRQEKKAAKKERKEAIERHFEEKRKAKEARFAAAEELKKLPGKKKPPTTTLKSAEGQGFAGGALKEQRGAKRADAGQRVNAVAKSAAAGTYRAKDADGHAAKSAGGASIASSTDPNAIPLNKYIAHGGICSRRDAAELIRHGKVTVNGQLVEEPGLKVLPEDTVKVNGKKVTISRNFVYILLNKPKDYITTTDDPQGRKTVLDLIRQATSERVFPVGRLDRNTSGVLLLTNDGELAQKLAHPKHEIKKIYHVTLDKPLTKADFDAIAAGVELEDGVAYVDVLAYADPKDKTQVGLEIHSGRNRIVRRIFEKLGYDVRGLDRVTYAGLTKKNVQRGHWRMLTEKEIRILKYLNSSFRGSLAPAKPGASAIAAAIGEEEEDAPKRAPGKSDRTPGKPFRAAEKPARTESTPGEPFRPAGKSDRTFGKPDRAGRPDRADHPDRSERAPGKPFRATGKSDRTDRAPGKFDRTDRAERTPGKPFRATGKPDRAERTPGKPFRPAGKSDRAFGKPDRPDRTPGADRTGKPSRSKKAQDANGLRGRKSGGSYNKAKAKSQRSPGRRRPQ